MAEPKDFDPNGRYLKSIAQTSKTYRGPKIWLTNVTSTKLIIFMNLIKTNQDNLIINYKLFIVS